MQGAVTVTRLGPGDWARGRSIRLRALQSDPDAFASLYATEAAFEEDDKGSLSVGKLADIVVLTKDILDCPEDEIPRARVRYTFVGGKLRYDSAQ